MNTLFQKYMGSASRLAAPDPPAVAAPNTPTPSPPVGDGGQGGTPTPTPQEPTPAPGETPTPGDGGAGGSEAPSSETPPAAGGDPTPPVGAPSEGDSIQRRIDRLTAEKWTERRAREQAESQNRILQERIAALTNNETPPAPVLGATPALAPPGARLTVTPEQLTAEANRIAQQNKFNEDVAAEIGKGRTSHNDFDQVASNLQRFGELPRTFVEGALATGRGADVIYALGKDLAEADRILTLPPMQQAVAIASLANKLETAPKPKLVSDAPVPITPRVGGTKASTPSLDDDALPIKDWMALREKQVAAQPKRR